MKLNLSTVCLLAVSVQGIWLSRNWISHVFICESFTRVFVCCCCNLMMFYDWRECVISVDILGTKKNKKQKPNNISLCNCIDTWQQCRTVYCIVITRKHCNGTEWLPVVNKTDISYQGLHWWELGTERKSKWGKQIHLGQSRDFSWERWSVWSNDRKSKGSGTGSNGLLMKASGQFSVVSVLLLLLFFVVVFCFVFTPSQPAPLYWSEIGG